MKKDIHPQYYKEAKVSCACGNKFTVGATREKIEIEICNKCHPFYTGKQQLIDTAKRAEKFSARKAKASPDTLAKKKAKTSARKIQKKQK